MEFKRGLLNPPSPPSDKIVLTFCDNMIQRWHYVLLVCGTVMPQRKSTIWLDLFSARLILSCFIPHTTHKVFLATKMDSFHLVLYRRETRLACRGYEELTVELTIYQRKHWRFDCCRGCLGWPRVPKRAVQTFPTWTRRVFIACYSMIVRWICCSFGFWRWGLRKPQCMMEVRSQARPCDS